MRTSKKSTYLVAIITASICAYAISYWVVREKSYQVPNSDKRTLPSYAPNGMIFLGMWPEEATVPSVPMNSDEASKQIARTEKRVNFCRIFYAPLIWIDRRVTGVIIFAQKRPGY